MTSSSTQFNEYQVQCEACQRWVSIDQIAFDEEGRLVCAGRECVEIRTAILIKPQPPAVRVDGWDV